MGGLLSDALSDQRRHIKYERNVLRKTRDMYMHNTSRYVRNNTPSARSVVPRLSRPSSSSCRRRASLAPTDRVYVCARGARTAKGRERTLSERERRRRERTRELASRRPLPCGATTLTQSPAARELTIPRVQLGEHELRRVSAAARNGPVFTGGQSVSQLGV